MLLCRHHHLQQRPLALNAIDNQPTTKEPVTTVLAEKQLQLEGMRNAPVKNPASYLKQQSYKHYNTIKQNYNKNSIMP